MTIFIERNFDSINYLTQRHMQFITSLSIINQFRMDAFKKIMRFFNFLPENRT